MRLISVSPSKSLVQCLYPGISLRKMFLQRGCFTWTFFSARRWYPGSCAVALKENNDEAVTAEYADGSDACKKALLMMKVNRFQADILEGMACQGGNITDWRRKYAESESTHDQGKFGNQDKMITSTLEKYVLLDIDLQIKNDEVGIGTFVTRFLPFNVEGFHAVYQFRCI